MTISRPLTCLALTSMTALVVSCGTGSPSVGNGGSGGNGSGAPLLLLGEARESVARLAREVRSALVVTSGRVGLLRAARAAEAEPLEPLVEAAVRRVAAVLEGMRG